MDQYINREIFIVSGDDDEEISDIFIAENRIELDEHLASLNPATDGDIRVFHGIITYAEYLPTSFHNKSVYIVVESNDQPGQGCVVEGGETPEEVAREIESIIISSSPMTYGNLSIDDIYILYGYQIGLGIAIDEEDLDEEKILSCEIIADEIIDVEKASLKHNSGGES